jgi:Protein of unknown function (DUF3293)
MALRPQRIAAYLSAEYVVFGDPGMVLRIGEPSPALDALLDAEGAQTACYITAANPYGRRAAEEENVLATTALLEAQRRAGYACYAGEGRDPKRQWPAEPSVLVLGISLADAQVLGRSYEQNAIVFARKGGAPELVVLAPPDGG